jgi:hypothetical protein
MNQKIITLIICILNIIVIQLYAQQSQKSTIAVLDFEGQGISTVEASILANRFRSELVNTNAFIVIERGQMEDILKEVGFQQTGCTSSECLIEIGQILNVQKMIGGTIGKLGEVYAIDLRMIDVGTAQILETVSEDHEGDLGELLQVIRDLAFKFADRQKSLHDLIPRFDLDVTSQPKGAECYINERIMGTTPISIKLQKGSYKIKVEMKDYLGWEKEIKLYDDTDLNAKLESALAELDIISSPAGATVFINNYEIGKTPFSRSIRKGKYTVTLIKENYNDWERTISHNEDQEIEAEMDYSVAYLEKLKKENAAQRPEDGLEDEGGSNFWLWATAGAVVVGGAAAYLLLAGDKSDETATQQDLPMPPPKP